jgi:SAM-dependent methyltransferase
MEIAGSAIADVPYILAHSDREVRRLKHQADIINPITRRIFLSAGIGPGMRVLDVGCGAGDVTLLVSELVGGTGHVVGIDRVPAALTAAGKKVSTHALHNVSFREGDPAALTFDKAFDAVVGRYVLMFQADPVAMLRAATRHVRPGGVVVFHEPDWDGVRSNPPSPAYDQICRWIVETFRRAGIETEMGVKLDTAFQAAGLSTPAMHLESVIGGKSGGIAWAHQTFELLVTMMPEIIHRGVATEAELDIAAIEGRMLRDIAAGSVIVGRSEIGAWSRSASH